MNDLPDVANVGALPASVNDAIRAAGYYPHVVGEVVDIVLAGEDVQDFLVQPETVFEHTAVRRHLNVILVTATRMVVAHLDDHAVHEPGIEFDYLQEVAPNSRDKHGNHVFLHADTETIALKHIRSIQLNHVIANPESARIEDRDIALTITWGHRQHIELERAVCEDPTCEAEHGTQGQITSQDAVVRASGQTDGPDAVRRVLRFARRLSALTAGLD